MEDLSQDDSMLLSRVSSALAATVWGTDTGHLAFQPCCCGFDKGSTNATGRFAVTGRAVAAHKQP